jgi:hypothetical protein
MNGDAGSDVEGDEEVDFARDSGRAGWVGVDDVGAGKNSAGCIGFDCKFCAAHRAHGFGFAIR